MSVQEITLDLDGYDHENIELTLLRAWHTLRRQDEVIRLRGRVSSSGNGIHISAWIRADEETARMYRGMLGDDTQRHHYDYLRDRQAKNVLFDQKQDGSVAGPWRTNVDTLLGDYRAK